ncbi:MAG: TIM barrel protein [Saprospiraceae bacterium]|nr:TIM barrel protein [Saprospiraceae bacterium]
MKRRHFVKSSLLSSAAIPPVNAGDPIGNEEMNPFKLKFAPHLGMFKHHAGEDPIDQINFMADQGFHAFEDNNMMRREVPLQEKIGKALVDRNMTMGVFVTGRVQSDGRPVLPGNHEDLRAAFLDSIRESIDVAKRVNATWMTVVPGRKDFRLDMGYQTSNVVELLKRASDILEPHGLVMVLEPLNFFNHPGYFLTEIPQTFQICKAVDSPSCKILFDIYHQQIQEGNIIPNIDMAWDEIAYFQIGDNPGRKEPTTGEINYPNIFRVIHEKGFKGVLGMEHGNYYPGKEGEQKLIEAYRSVDLVND